MIKRNQRIEVTPTPEELASEFCGLDADEQARFFNEIDKLSSKWDNGLFCFQMQALTDSEILTREGRCIMETIGEYAR